MKPLSNSKVQNATQLLIQGKSCCQVSNTLKISVSSAWRIRKRVKEYIPPPKIGHKSKISKRLKRVLAQKYSTGKLETLKDGQQYTQSIEGIHVVKQSILNYLESENMKAFIKQKRPYLLDNHKKERYQFAKEHLNWTLEGWKNVMFSYETLISRIGSYGRKYYFKKRGDTSIRPHHFKKTKQGGGGKMMIWGCITYFGVGDACWIPDKMNSVFYVEVLKDYVFASRDWYSMNKSKFLFQQDNAKIHTASFTLNFIKRSKIPITERPANSPDLNLIETIWSYLKMKLDRYPTAPKNLDDLWERVQDVWTSIPIEFIQGLYSSMPERMRKLYKCKGDNIK